MLERKLTEILSADVAGYSRLMRADEAVTLATFKEYRGAWCGDLSRAGRQTHASVQTESGRVEV